MAYTFLVTGGSGFVGKALCFSLVRDGHTVRSISRHDSVELARLGVETVQADIGIHSKRLHSAFSGVEGVFHTAANVSLWGAFSEFHQSNVVGTRNVIELCRREGISKLVFTSTPSVVADGTDRCNVDESYPYPDKFLSHYAHTKAVAEQAVLAADSGSLYTCALRPHLVWGPGDTNLVPTIVERAKSGKLVRIGRKRVLVDVTYIDDCITAHRLAMDALSTNTDARGKPYFISQGEPVDLWGWINCILDRHRLPPITRVLNAHAAKLLAELLEILSRIRPGNHEPRLTTFLVDELSTSHYFSIERARQLLNYDPKFPVDAALERTFPATPHTNSADGR